MRGWLKICAILVVALVALGGYTRLTDSGLSMVEWRLQGFVPPLEESRWREEFNKYRLSPEFRLKNPGMELDGFKRIYLIEYGHRALARVLGIVFLLPFIWFSLRRVFSFYQWLFLALVGGLMGGQGWLGWKMVQSGLADEPRVAPLLLASHLSLAMVIYGCLLLAGWNFGKGGRLFSDRVGRFTHRLALFLPFLLLVTIFSGGLNAGNQAGAVFNTFPLMNGELAPQSTLDNAHIWRSWLENPISLHFTHRVLAFLCLLVSLWVSFGLMLRSNVRLSGSGAWLLLAVFTQIGLGAAVVLRQPDLTLAWAHQLGGVLLFTAGLRAASVARV